MLNLENRELWIPWNILLKKKKEHTAEPERLIQNLDPAQAEKFREIL